jgi:hypothetical protein
MPQIGLECCIVYKCHDHIRDLDRRILHPNLKLFKPALASAHIDLVVVIPKIHLTLPVLRPPIPTLANTMKAFLK